MNQQNNFRLPEQNFVILSGRATRDSELRYTTAKGTAVCSFDIAMSRRMRDSATGQWKDAEPVYVPILLWGEQAERYAERIKKGVPVYVEGRLQSSSWEDKDTKKMRTKIEVVAARVQVLLRPTQTQDPAAPIGAKVSDDENYKDESPMPQNTNKAADFGDDDEDIPF
ncbi:MAG: single-stranded DNA-binding protein [Elusimicrobiota bacterium]|jgi:single-strand DNA-binding protein|nr:single-stranded DNA-binding protein [Elusimicrobiota bacterium]